MKVFRFETFTEVLIKLIMIIEIPSDFVGLLSISLTNSLVKADLPQSFSLHINISGTIIVVHHLLR